MTNKDCLKVNREIHIGEWCLFVCKSKLLIGLVLGFSRLNGSTYSTREYGRSYAEIPSVDSNPIGALCSYYDWNSDGELHQAAGHPFYLKIDTYKATIHCPNYESGCLKINDILLSRIKGFQGERVNNWLHTNHFIGRISEQIVSKLAVQVKNTDEQSNGEPSTKSIATNIGMDQFCVVAVPSFLGPPKNFIGQVCGRNRDGITIKFKKKSYDKYFFPPKNDFSVVREDEILHCLETPIINKRDQFLFPEVKQLNFKIN